MEKGAKKKRRRERRETHTTRCIFEAPSESVLHMRVHLDVRVLCLSDSFMLSMPALHVYNQERMCWTSVCLDQEAVAVRAIGSPSLKNSSDKECATAVELRQRVTESIGASTAWRRPNSH